LQQPRPLTHLYALEAESIHIIREAVAEGENPVLLYSIGKDSSVLLHLGLARGVGPITHGSEVRTDVMKTQALRQALDRHRFDMALGGARRDEERSRAKERIFSLRNARHRWNPKRQRPGGSATAKASACSHYRTGPNSTYGFASNASRSKWCRSISPHHGRGSGVPAT
jgi:3'-phosphoadenosine 5'-phosphosulfate sulfotransferase (PAPS reductase)/FAD synthetase